MDITDLLSDGRPQDIERVNGVYQFNSGTFIGDVLKKTLAHKNLSICLRKKGIEIFNTIYDNFRTSTSAPVGMLIEGSNAGLIERVNYLLTFQLSENFLKEHRRYGSRVDLVELFRSFEPYRWGDSIESARTNIEDYQSLYSRI